MTTVNGDTFIPCIAIHPLAEKKSQWFVRQLVVLWGNNRVGSSIYEQVTVFFGSGIHMEVHIDAC